MLYFTNPGEIDIRGATIAGLSAKQTDNPIGLFGTGLKYAIACVLRWGGEITIYSGTEAHKFSIEEIDFRGASFAQILHNGAPIGITSDYGKHWEPWMVFRELYANARDEGGSVSKAHQAPRVGTTLIAVSCEELEAEYEHRDTIILPEGNASGSVQILPGASSFIYYRGVRVGKAEASYTYNVLEEQQLTEDRTLANSYAISVAIAFALGKLTDKDIIRRVLQKAFGKSDCFEQKLIFPSYMNPSEEFLDVAQELFQLNRTTYADLTGFLSRLRPAVTKPQPIVLSTMRQQMLDRACALVNRMGLDHTACTISVADLGQAILGMYNKELDEVFLSPLVFDQGTKQVLSTLYEELLHRKTALQDLTYSMQTHLFNTIVSLYEEHVFQEPI